MTRKLVLLIFFILIVGFPFAWCQDMLRNLGETQDYVSKRISSLSLFEDRNTGMSFQAKKAVHILTSYYDQQGKRYPVLTTDVSQPGETFRIALSAEFGEQHDLTLYYLTGPGMGNIRILGLENGQRYPTGEATLIPGYSTEKRIQKIVLPDVPVKQGKNTLILSVAEPSPQASGNEFGFVGLSQTPSQRRFITSWNLIGPFEAPDMSHLQTIYPPEEEISLKQSYTGKQGRDLSWTQVQIDESGFVRLQDLIQPNEQAVAYGLTYIYSPEDIETHLLLGSDDGVRVWLNQKLIHTNPAYRGCYPDQDKMPVHLNKGWNRLLIKVLQGAGGWGFYARFIDPAQQLRFATVSHH